MNERVHYIKKIPEEDVQSLRMVSLSPRVSSERFPMSKELTEQFWEACIIGSFDNGSLFAAILKENKFNG